MTRAADTHSFVAATQWSGTGHAEVAVHCLLVRVVLSRAVFSHRYCRCKVVCFVLGLVRPATIEWRPIQHQNSPAGRLCIENCVVCERAHFGVRKYCFCIAACIVILLNIDAEICFIFRMSLVIYLWYFVWKYFSFSSCVTVNEMPEIFRW